MNASNKTILVTGATGGIGAAVCSKLVESGYSLILVARDKTKLADLARNLNKRGKATCIYTSVDMTDDSSVDDFSRFLSERNIKLAGAVIMPPQVPPTGDCLPENDAWRSMFQRSFIGPLNLLKSAIARMEPDLASGERSKIVIISGISSAQVLGHYATSNVLRCAWLAEAKTLAFALGERGIHVNTISLGGTMTPDYTAAVQKRAAAANMTFDERLAQETSNVPLKKYGTPEEVAKVVESFLSPFSDHLTGINLLHDGGFTRAY